MYVTVIARGQGFMAVNRPESEGVARGQGRFTGAVSRQCEVIIYCLHIFPT
jgi:hypothetical protein